MKQDFVDDTNLDKPIKCKMVYRTMIVTFLHVEQIATTQFITMLVA